MDANSIQLIDRETLTSTNRIVRINSKKDDMTNVERAERIVSLKTQIETIKRQNRIVRAWAAIGISLMIAFLIIIIGSTVKQISDHAIISIDRFKIGKLNDEDDYSE